LIILQKRIAGLSSPTLQRFVLRAKRALGLPGTVNVLVTGNGQMRSLNRQFRGKDKATDVLSFPASPLMRDQTQAVGDIVISAEIARQNASRFGHPVANEVKILVLHGLLHMAGYDHERDNGQMARKEKRLRVLLNLEPGLIERTESKSGKIADGNRRRSPDARQRRS